MFCQSCGNEVGNQEQFCRHCGARLQFQENATPYITQNPVDTAVSKTILNRRGYFKTVTEKKVRNRIMALNILTYIMLAVCGVAVLCSFITITEMESSIFGAPPTIFIIIAVAYMLLCCIVAATLSVLMIRFKHFGFAIPLLCIGIIPINLSSGGIYKLFGFQVMDGISSVDSNYASYYETSNSVLEIVSQVTSTYELLMFGVLIAMLVLSILVTRDYNRYKKSNQQVLKYI